MRNSKNKIRPIKSPAVLFMRDLRILYNLIFECLNRRKTIDWDAIAEEFMESDGANQALNMLGLKNEWDYRVKVTSASPTDGFKKVFEWAVAEGLLRVTEVLENSEPPEKKGRVTTQDDVEIDYSSSETDEEISDTFKESKFLFINLRDNERAKISARALTSFVKKGGGSFVSERKIDKINHLDVYVIAFGEFNSRIETFLKVHQHHLWKPCLVLDSFITGKMCLDDQYLFCDRFNYIRDPWSSVCGDIQTNASARTRAPKVLKSVGTSTLGLSDNMNDEPERTEKEMVDQISLTEADALMVSKDVATNTPRADDNKIDQAPAGTETIVDQNSTIETDGSISLEKAILVNRLRGLVKEELLHSDVFQTAVFNIFDLEGVTLLQDKFFFILKWCETRAAFGKTNWTIDSVLQEMLKDKKIKHLKPSPSLLKRALSECKRQCPLFFQYFKAVFPNESEIFFATF